MVTTRKEEELQTLQRFIKNQNELFGHEQVIQGESRLKEPADVMYKRVQYQITYGDAKKLAELRKSISNEGNYSAIRGIVEQDYAGELIDDALKKKKNKSDKGMTLLIDCTYTSFGTLPDRKKLCEKHFNNNGSKFAGLWQHIFVVFLDGNIHLR